jgi:GxxExxY protein
MSALGLINCAFARKQSTSEMLSAEFVIPRIHGWFDRSSKPKQSGGAMHPNQITERIIGAAINVHKELGPGLLESTYEACLAFELDQRGLRFDRQRAVPVVYRGVRIECGYRLDLLVEDCVIVEIKSVSRLEPINTAQMLSYLKLTEKQLGLILNFNVPVMVSGIERVVRGFTDYEQPPKARAYTPKASGAQKSQTIYPPENQKKDG